MTDGGRGSKKIGKSAELVFGWPLDGLWGVESEKKHNLDSVFEDKTKIPAKQGQRRSTNSKVQSENFFYRERAKTSSYGSAKTKQMLTKIRKKKQHRNIEVK